MRFCPHPAEIRRFVSRAFEQYGASADELVDLQEDILIEDQRLVARSYRLGDLFAMWLIEVGVLQFYDAAGNMLRTVNLFEESIPQRMAA